MKFSTRGRYGLQVMVDLAELSAGGPVSLRNIAERKHMSEHYLGQVVPDLRKAGLVRSIRGTKGGYVIARPAAQIVIGEIIRAIDGPAPPVECNRTDSAQCCQDMAYCATRHIWGQVLDAVSNVIDNVTLQQLLDESRAAQV
ncbi:MAG: Rrf2 family transcriptional regulator [Gracilibacteraceae bacterium]|nr:Rrf2 family transcriptional regulator [Gracilibacteraceae bacterium]